MFYKAPNKYITEGTAFEIDGVQYPANWLNLSSSQEKFDAGLVEVTNANSPEDDRFYWVSSSLDGAVLTYTNTPKDLDTLKTHWISTINNTAYTLLQPSDWMVVKAQETQTQVPEDWKTYRATVRTTANTARSAIASSNNISSLQQAIKVEWPNDPNFVAFVS